MLRPVKLNASADPWSAKPHQGRFDDMVIIHKIILVGLIIRPLDPAPQFRQHHHLQVFIFQPYRLIHLILFLITDFLNGGIGIDFTRASLIHTAFQEHGVLIRLSRLICRNHNGLFPDFYCIHAKYLLSLLSMFFLFTSCLYYIR